MASRKLRRVTHRKPAASKRLQTEAETMLETANLLLERASGLDTEVRDIVAEGLARIVYAAYDTMSIAICVADSDAVAYIQTKTYEWFRAKGFVEWFCAGASTLFRTTPRSFYRYHVEKANKAVRIKLEKVG